MSTRRKFIVTILFTSCYFLLTIPIAAQDTAAYGMIYGQIKDLYTKDGIPSATVSLEGTTRGTVCDAEGRFALTEIPIGIYQVKASAFGYKPHINSDIMVSGSRPVELVITLTEQDVELAEVDVVAEYFQKTSDAPLSTLNQTFEEIRRLPGGLEDVVRAVSILPGVAQVQAGRNDLIVRGGAPSENLFIIDNLEVPNINHFGTQGSSGGPLSYVNLDFVDNTTFSTGGFGVRYGDKLSSILSIDLKNGRKDRIGGKATISASQFGLNVDGPLSENSSFIFSARRSYLDFIFKAAGFGFVPEYWDFIGRVGYRPGPHDQISILGIGVIDNVRIFNDTEEQRYDNARILYSTQHQLVSGGAWNHIFKDGYSLLSLSSVYSDFEYYQNDTSLVSIFRNSSKEYEVAVRGEVVLQLTHNTEISTGVQLKHILFSSDLTVPPSRISTGELLALNSSYKTRATKSAVFFQLAQRIRDFRVIAGGRIDYFDLLSMPAAFSPRLSVSYQIGPRTSITGSAGVFRQSPSYIWLVSDLSNRGLPFIRATQYILGYEHLLRDDIRLSLEGYTKTYADYPVSLDRPYLTMANTGAGFGGSTEGFASFGIDRLAGIGSGEARGIELSVQKKSTDDHYYGTFSVSYNESWYKALDGVKRPGSFDQRWILNAGGGYIFNEMWEANMKFRLATGRPYTPYSADGTQNPELTNTERVLPNHSLDLRIERRFMFTRWNLIAYIDVQNVYNRKPKDVPRYNLRTHRLEENQSIGILPSIGISAEF